MGRKASGLSNDSTTTRKYLITGATDEENAIYLLGIGTPPTVGNLVPTSPDIEEVNPATGTYIGTIQYRAPDSPEVQQERENAWTPPRLTIPRLADPVRWSWRDQASQFQIYATASDKVIIYGQGFTSPPTTLVKPYRSFGGAIGAEPSGGDVSGTTRYFFAEEWTAEKVVDKSEVNQSFLDGLRALRGTTNETTFSSTMFTTGNAINFVAKTALYLGSEGTEEEEAVRMRFHFLIGQNETGLNVGGITGVAKNAHDYLWPLWKTDEDPDTEYVVKKALQINVHEIYSPKDWGALEAILS